jgi:hypothetical protein
MKRINWVAKSDRLCEASDPQFFAQIQRVPVAPWSESKTRYYWRGEVRFFMRLDKNPVDAWSAYLKERRSTQESAMRACNRLIRRIVDNSP